MLSYLIFIIIFIILQLDVLSWQPDNMPNYCGRQLTDNCDGITGNTYVLKWLSRWNDAYEADTHTCKLKDCLYPLNRGIWNKKKYNHTINVMTNMKYQMHFVNMAWSTQKIFTTIDQNRITSVSSVVCVWFGLYDLYFCTWWGY